MDAVVGVGTVLVAVIAIGMAVGVGVEDAGVVGPYVVVGAACSDALELAGGWEPGGGV